MKGKRKLEFENKRLNLVSDCVFNALKSEISEANKKINMEDREIRVHKIEFVRKEIKKYKSYGVLEIKRVFKVTYEEEGYNYLDNDNIAHFIKKFNDGRTEIKLELCL